MADRNFDELAARFERKLYGNPRGQIRLQLVTEALLQDCSAIQQPKKMRTLDAGCGLGQIAMLLAQHGHHVTACDLSPVLIERAQTRIAETDAKALENIDFHCCSVQSLEQHVEGTFDLIVFHAVLEWLEKPREALESMLRWLKPGGELSLLFYNRHSIVLKNLLRGDFRRIDQQDYKGNAGGLTPGNPLLPSDVEQWLGELELDIVSRHGIRTFYDYMEQSMDRRREQLASTSEILRMEKMFSTQEPYRSLARYQLWHCRRRD